MGEFWAAIAGAIVGALASGLTTWKIQKAESERQDSEKRKSVARSLFIKIVRIYNDLKGFERHLEEARISARENKVDFGWPSVRAIANPPRKIEFSMDELTFVSSLSDDTLFNDVLILDAIHWASIDAFATYSMRRMEVSDALPADMDGSFGNIELSPEQYRKFSPRFVELNILIADIDRHASKDANACKDILNRYSARLAGVLGKSPSLQFVESEETDESKSIS